MALDNNVVVNISLHTLSSARFSHFSLFLFIKRGMLFSGHSLWHL